MVFFLLNGNLQAFLHGGEAAAGVGCARSPTFDFLGGNFPNDPAFGHDQDAVAEGQQFGGF
jgi:hypothetical protein